MNDECLSATFEPLDKRLNLFSCRSCVSARTKSVHVMANSTQKELSIGDMIKNYIPQESRNAYESLFSSKFDDLKFKLYDSRGIVLTCRNSNPWLPPLIFLFHSPKSEQYKNGVYVTRIDTETKSPQNTPITAIPLKLVEQLGSSKIIGMKAQILAKLIIVRVYSIRHKNGKVVFLSDEITAGRIRYTRLDWLAKNGMEYSTGNDGPINKDRCNVKVDHEWNIIEVLGFY